MAHRYVYSGAAGAGTGADWANAFTTLAAGLSGAASGDNIWIASDHAESVAGAVSFIFPTGGTPTTLISVNRAGSVPPVGADITSGATVTRSGSGAGITITQMCYCVGVTFQSGSGANNTCDISFTGTRQVFENCKFQILSTGTTSRITPANATGVITEWNDCTIEVASNNQALGLILAMFRWRNNGSSPFSGATTPLQIIRSGINNTADIVLEGLDLSAINSGNVLVTPGACRTIDLVNCELGPSAGITGAPTGRARVRVIGSHSAGIVRRDEIYDFTGTLTTETTIKRTAGASDGTTDYCWKIATTANCRRTYPFVAFDGELWNDDTGAGKTLTIHTVTDNVTLTDEEIWLEVGYLGDAGAPIASLITDANATIVTTPVNQTDDSAEAWTTTGLTTPVKQKLEVTFTPQMAGPISWRVKVAKASTTVYVCPKPDLA